MFMDQIRGYVSLDSMADLGQTQDFNELAVVFDRTGLTRDEATALAKEIADTALAPVGVRVRATYVPEPGSHRLGDIFSAVSVLLLAMGIMALLLSGLLVVNTVTALLMQQTRQIGIMKAIGGRSSQIARMYFFLVAIYGLLAVLIGVPTGSLSAAWFARFANGLLNFGDAPAGPPGYTYALGIAVGLVVPLAVAFFPVRAGTRVSVVRALESVGVTGTGFGHGLVDRLLGRLRGLPRPVALALRNTFSRKGRLVLTLATLALASAVVMSVMSVRTSMLRTVSDMSSWWRYDVEVSFSRPVTAAAVDRAAAKVEGVTAAESWIVRGASFQRPDNTANDAFRIEGLPADTTFVRPRLVSGSWFVADEPDGIVVNTDAVNEEGLALGDAVTFEIGGIEHVWRIVGIIEGQMRGPVVFAQRSRLEAVLAAPGEVQFAVVRSSGHSDGAQEQVADRLEHALREAGFPVSGVQTTNATALAVANQLGVLVAFLVVMAVILAAVGVIGLAGTMIINVLESTREIGVMRAVGASHAAIFQVFVTEGVTMGILAWCIGAVFTWPLSFWLVRMLETAIKMPLSYEFSWVGLGAWLLLVAVISALASLIPAYRASQVSVRDAIAYE
jgi:putative ABC transport system permease protein